MYRGFYLFDHYFDQDIVLRRSGCRVAVYDLYHFDDGRNPIVLYGNTGNVSVKDVFGGEGSSHLYL